MVEHLISAIVKLKASILQLEKIFKNRSVKLLNGKNIIIAMYSNLWMLKYDI